MTREKRFWGGFRFLSARLCHAFGPSRALLYTNFLPGVALLVGIHEVLSIFTFNSPFGGELWSIRSGEPPGLLQPLRREPTRVCSALRISYVSPLTAPRLPRPPVDYLNGDLGWDPLGLKPTDPKELKEMQVPKPAP